MRLILQNTFASILFLFLFDLVSGQTLEADIDELLQEHFQADGPGVAALVAVDGEVVYRKAIGQADLKTELRLAPDMVFKVGSITKQFTAVGILMLMEQGQLKLDDEITKYLPDYPCHDQRITIHQLLTHTSGIKSYTSLKAIRKIATKELTPLEIIDVFKDEEMDFKPGEGFKYNNSGYILLGYIIEKVSGQSYGEFMRQNIFQPLNLSATSYRIPEALGDGLVLAKGYSKKKDKWVDARDINLSVPYAAGSILSNVDDLLKWQKALNANTLLSPETMRLAYTNHNPSEGSDSEYGYGWFMNEAGGAKTIEHGGDIFGFAAMEIYVPEHDAYVVLLTNCDRFSPTDISRRVAAIAIGNPYPTAKDAIALTPDQLEKFVGEFQFDNGQTRFIRIEEGQLYSKRKDSEKEFKIMPYSENEFMFEDLGFVFYRFEKDGQSVVFKSGHKDFKGTRVASEAPAHGGE